MPIKEPKKINYPTTTSVKLDEKLHKWIINDTKNRHTSISQEIRHLIILGIEVRKIEISRIKGTPDEVVSKMAVEAEGAQKRVAGK